VSGDRRRRVRVRDAPLIVVRTSVDDPTMPTAGYVTLIDYATATLTYVGHAAAGTGEASPGWRITRVDESGVDTAFTYPDGEATFTRRWDERTTYTYA
jgi:hypothetical protein